MKLGLFLRPVLPATEIAELARLAEDVGIDFVGVGDGQMIWRNPYVCLTAAALATSRITLGPWVTQPVTRHPTVTANAISTLSELSGGRAMVGIGNGDDSVITINRPRASLDELADAVEVIRQLMSGAEVQRQGQTWHMAVAQESGLPTPPIYWAASGPRSLRYAGRYADGVIHSGWLVPQLIEEDLGYVAEGARENGRDPNCIARVFHTGLAVHPESATARQWAKPYVARGLIYAASTRLPNWDEQQRAELERHYNFYQHMMVENPATERVPDEMVALKSVAGNPKEVLDTLTTIAESGYTHVAMTPMGDVRAVIELLGRAVLPYLKATN